jgi:hypothetical protein
MLMLEARLEDLLRELKRAEPRTVDEHLLGRLNRETVRLLRHEPAARKES